MSQSPPPLPQGNPTAPPHPNRADVSELEDFFDAFYMGKLQYGGQGALTLPPRCIACGVDASQTKPRTKKLIWTPPWIYIIVLLNLLVGAVLGLALQKKLIVNYRHCPSCYKKRIVWQLIALGLFLGGAALLFFGIIEEKPPVGVAGAAGLILALILVIVTAFPLSIANYSNRRFVIKAQRKRYRQALQEEHERLAKYFT